MMELLDYFGIAPRKLMPNLWRIVVNCMEIWLAANEDMIKVGELIYLYRLKESKEYEYYELVPWEKRTRIVRGLPSSFRYWKSRFFFVSRDDFEIPFNGDWGDIPRLLRRWGTPTLGALVFLPVVFSFVVFVVIITDSFASCFAQLRDGLSSKAGIRSVLRRR